MDLVKKIWGLGNIAVKLDSDGVVRKIPFLSRSGGVVPSLGIRVAADYLDVKPDQIEITPGRHIIFKDASFPDGRKKDITIPIDQQFRGLINYPGPLDSSFSHYSVKKLFEIKTDPTKFELLKEDLADTIVIVSMISSMSKDFGNTPLENHFPLSGVHSEPHKLHTDR